MILLDIYPAREEPISGITSDALLSRINSDDKKVLSPTEAVEVLSSKDRGVLLTIGAGDIDRIVPLLKNQFGA